MDGAHLVGIERLVALADHERTDWTQIDQREGVRIGRGHQRAHAFVGVGAGVDGAVGPAAGIELRGAESPRAAAQRYGSSSGFAGGRMFAPRLRAGDRVIYATKLGRWDGDMQESLWKLVAALQVTEVRGTRVGEGK